LWLMHDTVLLTRACLIHFCICKKQHHNIKDMVLILHSRPNLQVYPCLHHPNKRKKAKLKQGTSIWVRTCKVSSSMAG
jgi:hypothetical protein